MSKWFCLPSEKGSTVKGFVCVEVLRLSQPIRVMSSMVSLPKYPFSWKGLVLLRKYIDFLNCFLTFCCHGEQTQLAHDVYTTSAQRRCSVRRCIDVEPMLYKRHVPAGFAPHGSKKSRSSLRSQNISFLGRPFFSRGLVCMHANRKSLKLCPILKMVKTSQVYKDPLRDHPSLSKTSSFKADGHLIQVRMKIF